MKVMEIQHVRKSFDDQLHVLKDISLSVDKGEVVAIIGPSGSGKSTLLRCATLLTAMDSGELSYLGKKAAWNDESGRAVYAKDLREIRSCFGLVFQNFNLFPHYSVMKNLIDAPISVMHRDPAQVRQEAAALLEKMGLGVPAMTRVFHRLRAMGVDIDPSVYTIQQAKDVILAKLGRGNG